jgi:hypothetical protein
MTLSLVLEIIKLALELVEDRTTGGASDSSATAKVFVKIAQRANAGYQRETGQAIDPAKIREWSPIDPAVHGV